MNTSLLALLAAVALVGVIAVVTQRRKVARERLGIPSKDGYIKERAWADPPPGLVHSARVVGDVMILHMATMKIQSAQYWTDFAEWSVDRGCSRVIMDLSADRSFVGHVHQVMVCACALCHKASVDMVFVVPVESTRVRYTMKVTKTDRFLTCYPDELSALRALDVIQGVSQQGPFAVATYSRPHGGGPENGDRFEVIHRGERLIFFLADATGHGEKAAAFWRAHGHEFDRRWAEFVDYDPGPTEIEDLARDLNQYLWEHSTDSAVSTYLCLILGTLTSRGELRFASFGYGNHALIATRDGSTYGGGTDRQWGLKLGWISSEAWGSMPDSVLLHHVREVRRVTLITDGFLGDDHLEPANTLKMVQDLSRHVARVPLEEVVHVVTELPHENDDATVVVMGLEA